MTLVERRSSGSTGFAGWSIQGPRLKPSTRTMCWSNCRTSITTPVLSHFNGDLPCLALNSTRLPTTCG